MQTPTYKRIQLSIRATHASASESGQHVPVGVLARILSLSCTRSALQLSRCKSRTASLAKPGRTPSTSSLGLTRRTQIWFPEIPERGWAILGDRDGLFEGYVALFIRKDMRHRQAVDSGWDD